jgi:hypothetical protein
MLLAAAASLVAGAVMTAVTTGRAVSGHVARYAAGVAVAVEARSGGVIAVAVVAGVQNLRGRLGLRLEFRLGELEPRLGLHK